jgi:type IV secretory pathway TrbF-like protein
MQFVKHFLGERNGNGQAQQNGSRVDPLFKRNPNPWLDSRRSWNSQIDRAFADKHVFQLIAVACLLIALASVAGLTYLGGQSKMVPFVIQVDKLGEQVVVGQAQVAAPADPRVVRASLAAFISAVRTVTPDQDLQRKLVFSAYGMRRVKDPATVKANEFLGDTSEMSPFKRASRMTVDVEVNTVLQLTDRSWQVDWTETARDRDGAPLGKPQLMRAVLDIYLDPPPPDARQEQITRNPLGIWVRDFNWESR